VPKYFPTNPDQHREDVSTIADAEKAHGGGVDRTVVLRGVGYHDLFSLVGERRRPPYR
jgi:hypothetical protein